MKGSIFVIESGTDGSGKATQTELLYNRLKEEGYKVMKVEYPNYKSDSSALVKMYLDGKFGKKADDVDGYIASTFYAADRYASYKIEWEDFYLDGGIILADRYTTSNMVHQASKIDSKEDKDMFLNWLYNYEYGLYKLPQPSQVFFLDVPVEMTERLMKDRKNKITNESKKDIHESDIEYLKKTYSNSKYVAEKYNWSIIECMEIVDDDIKMKSIEDIHNEIYSKIKKQINTK
ncbi:dTMP kinase [Peptostreptococcus equinus]|uniref:Thymidylate kinase n=1 Tax=Peptostreptococcus equinus TaxID=3003601 RepID=A0ABY7JSI1_9FIRM|nr:thymidylate kinase [Peptostreptococcus sp. CBA3647]WAW15018.1 thymidylate kinase [Peptostreptococcus sp. CBA3647]